MPSEKMPLFGLLKLLEDSLNNILDTAVISSWNIRVNDSNCQLSIRFNMVDKLDDTVPIDSSNITFRKAPPSRVNRDRKRADAYTRSNNIFVNDVTEEDHAEQTYKSCLTECDFNANTNSNITPSMSSFNPQTQVDGTADQDIAHIKCDHKCESCLANGDSLTCSVSHGKWQVK